MRRTGRQFQSLRIARGRHLFRFSCRPLGADLFRGSAQTIITHRDAGQSLKKLATFHKGDMQAHHGRPSCSEALRPPARKPNCSSNG
jgi:hypothetical protein